MGVIDMIWWWIGFNLFIFAMLAIDLGLFHKKDHEISIKESLVWSVVWVLVALAFNAVIFYWRGKDVALQFFTGYLIERALSVDNLFVFLTIFSFFRVAARYQYKVLFWGIIGAVVMRALFIFSGVALINKFSWMIYVFGIFLIITGIKLLGNKEHDIEIEKNVIVKLFREIVPITPDYVDGKFALLKNGGFFATPLLVVLIVVETTDVVFALDSIPAILAITSDTFIVYTSNIFAILGLRALYFAIAGMMKMFRFLNYGLSLVLVFVGLKMMVSHFIEIPIMLSLGVITGVLALSIIVSLAWPEEKTK